MISTRYLTNTGTSHHSHTRLHQSSLLPFHGVLTPMPNWYWYNTNLQSLYLHDAAKLSFLICNKKPNPFQWSIKTVHSSGPWDFLNSFPILSLSQSVCSHHNATVVLHIACIHLCQNPCYVHSLCLWVLTMEQANSLSYLLHIFTQLSPYVLSGHTGWENAIQVMAGEI